MCEDRGTSTVQLPLQCGPAPSGGFEPQPPDSGADSGIVLDRGRMLRIVSRSGARWIGSTSESWD
jgi:hypothetical protein